MRRVILLLALTLPAYPWEFSYSATIDPQSPRFELPTVDLTGLQGGGANNVRYHLYSFTAQFSGLFTFSSLASWDNFLILYRTAFNPATPLVNAVVANDNNPTVGTAGFTAVLTGGEQYFVVTSLSANGSGSFQAANTVSSNVPEPSTWSLALAGLGYCWRLHLQRRKGPKR